MAKLQAAEDTMVDAVRISLAALKPPPEHTALALMARKYAKLIDEADDMAIAMSTYGPKLFACLDVLAGKTKPAAGGEPNVPKAPSALDTLRAARR